MKARISGDLGPSLPSTTWSSSTLPLFLQVFTLILLLTVSLEAIEAVVPAGLVPVALHPDVLIWIMLSGTAAFPGDEVYLGGDGFFSQLQLSIAQGPQLATGGGLIDLGDQLLVPHRGAGIVGVHVCKLALSDADVTLSVTDLSTHDHPFDLA